MKINRFIFCLILFCFGCSPLSESKPDTGVESDAGNSLDTNSDIETIPENCQQFDGEKLACAAAGCNRYNDMSPVWCIRGGKCLVDTDSPGFCGHSAGEYSHANFGFFRSDSEIASGFGGPPGGQWEECPEDVANHPLCRCLSRDLDVEEGECF